MPDSSSQFEKAWQKLELELDIWADNNETATFWWRDDDAISASHQLTRLVELSGLLDIPVSVSVIPAELEDSLADYLFDIDNVVVLQHGYAHESFALSGKKNIEMGGGRPTEEIMADLDRGSNLLEDGFGNKFIPVLVPPWNRIEDRIFVELHKTGFRGVSSMWARRSVYPAPGILQVNTHLDPVYWRYDRGFIGEVEAIDCIYWHLYYRRKGHHDGHEPTGILTHHLAQNEQVWQFCHFLFSRLNEHPAVSWLNARQIWK